MSETYAVKQGDTLISIAHDKGFRTWQTIWEHPDNAKLREQRKDPQVLAEGDSVVIPDKKPRDFTIETNKRHSFTVRALRARFRTIVKNDKGKPLAGKRFELEIEGPNLAPMTLGGLTGETGVIELEVHPKATTGTLKVWTKQDRVLTWKLQLGKLDPIDTVTGVKARLTNLGFLCGPIDAAENEDLKKALTRFQVVHKLELTGKIDDPTRQKLLSLHDHRA